MAAGASSFPRQRLDASGQVVKLWTLSAFVANYGNVPMSRTTVSLAGPDAPRFRVVGSHPGTQVIAPGADEVFAVEYAPSCAPPLAPPPALGPRQYEAELRVTTDGGEAVFALRGAFCPLMN